MGTTTAQRDDHDQTQATGLATFLMEVPPGREVRISSVSKFEKPFGAGLSSLPLPATRILVQLPDVSLHCTRCKGNRFFTCVVPDGSRSDENQDYLLIHYLCKNCNKERKVYALRTHFVNETDADVYKLGELPPFGPPLPSKLVSMVREDRELFMKGRCAEDQGLGIAAFAYYRRVVENQKNQLLNEIRKVAEREKADPELLEQIKAAKKERKFAAAVESIKTAIPASIHVQGKNPLTLLHNVLSANIHAEPDEKCLELATAIRTVLTEFAERLSEALKDNQALTESVKTLADYAHAKKPST